MFFKIEDAIYSERLAIKEPSKERLEYNKKVIEKYKNSEFQKRLRKASGLDK